MKLTTKLLPHQEEAYGKLKGLKVGALFMEQGTGKTRTTLELVKKRLDGGKADAVLWLCPCSVKKNLKEDILFHCGGMPEEIVIRGIESLSSSDRLYLMLRKLVETHKVFLVVDESSLAKNPSAIRTERIIALAEKCPYRLILNGTPVSKNEADLYAQFYILDWRILGYKSYWSFAANHLEFHAVKLPDGREIVDRTRIERVLNVGYLTEKIAPYTYQARKSECLSLPRKAYHTRLFWMTEEQGAEYDRVEQEYLEQVDEMKSETIYKLFTACQHVTSGKRVTSDPDKRMETEPIFGDPRDNPRIRALMELAEDLGEEKAIIFCKYQHEVSEILGLLPDAVEFTGRIPQAERQKNREAFRRDARFLVANKTCGAFGLNLQFCRNVVFYNNDFNLATRLQAEDRVHRMGQEHDVHVWDIICPDSIDGFISDCIARKEGMAEALKERIKDVQKEEKEKKWKKYTRKLTSTKLSSRGSDSYSGSSKTSMSPSPEGRTRASS